ncbi:MAG: integration host factor subunit alpha [Albidovulum sp.]|nr:integration host factor subunit alpha [Albidovulum sp.]MDE0531293.1 integration host factor subunit alpha [Albidovulum sp.]
MKQTCTKAYLAESIHRRFGLSRSECLDIVQTVIDNISGTLANGEQVKIASFGTFQVRRKKERIGRNPRNGTPAVITARQVVSFRPSRIMKVEVNSRET